MVVVLALSGCTVPAATERPSIPIYSPVREALSYFPADAPAVAIVSTDPQDPGLRRLAGSGALTPLRRAAERRGVFVRQLTALLRNDAVIGLPHVGGAPLAVLTTADPDALDTFARARVIDHRATRAGTYRGARLYLEQGWAFGVRDRVLLVGGSLRELTEALDTRVGSGAFEPAQLTAVLPDEDSPATFARAYVDLSALVDAGGPAVRAVPVLHALTGAGVALGASDVELRATVSAPLDGLTPLDVPIPPRSAGERPVVPADRPALAVADLAPLAAAAERALTRALPVTALRLAALRERLKVARVALTPELLHGPAVLTTGPMLRLDPRRPVVLEAALARAAHGLRTAPLRLTREGPLYRATDRGRLLARIGMVDGVLVAGRAPAARLLALARAPRTTLRSPALIRLPKAARQYPRPVVLTFAGGARRVRVDAFSGY